MKKIFKKSLLSALILGTSLSAFGFGASAEVSAKKEYLKLYENYTVEEFLERYNCSLSEGAGIDVQKALGSGLSVKGEICDYITVLLGDADGDGSVNSTDYLKLKSHILKFDELKDAYLEAADVNEDGTIDTTDLVMIKSDLLDKYSINLSITPQMGSSGYYPTAYLSNLENETVEKSDSSFLLKIRVDSINSSVSRLGDEIELKNYENPDYHAMQVSFTITEILSENGKDKFTVGQKLNAGQDFVHLISNFDGTHKLAISQFRPQLPLTELGREYVVMMRDLRLTNSNGNYKAERIEALPYSLFGIAPAWTKNLNSIDMFAEKSFNEFYQNFIEELQAKYCTNETIPEERTVRLIPLWSLT